jgi:DNA-binding response OmpR family regulator
MLTALDAEADQLSGLEIGADDYITKPFSTRELVARVRALLRRAYGSLSTVHSSLLEIGDLSLDMAQHIVKCNGQIIDLTPIEFSLLESFMKHPHQAFNRLQLMENSHGFAFDGYERTIDAHIKNLRRKIEPDPKKPCYILTIYGIGYKMGDGVHA